MLKKKSSTFLTLSLLPKETELKKLNPDSSSRGKGREGDRDREKKVHKTPNEPFS